MQASPCWSVSPGSPLESAEVVLLAERSAGTAALADGDFKDAKALALALPGCLGFTVGDATAQSGEEGAKAARTIRFFGAKQGSSAVAAPNTADTSQQWRVAYSGGAKLRVGAALDSAEAGRLSGGALCTVSEVRDVKGTVRLHVVEPQEGWCTQALSSGTVLLERQGGAAGPSALRNCRTFTLIAVGEVVEVLSGSGADTW